MFKVNNKDTILNVAFRKTFNNSEAVIRVKVATCNKSREL